VPTFHADAARRSSSQGFHRPELHDQPLENRISEAAAQSGLTELDIAPPQPYGAKDRYVAPRPRPDRRLRATRHQSRRKQGRCRQPAQGDERESGDPSGARHDVETPK
jgi:hypothetical protein